MLIPRLACGVRTKFRDFEFSTENNVIINMLVSGCIVLTPHTGNAVPI